MTSISEISKGLKILVEKYRRVKAEGKEIEFNEERVKLQFIIPFLETLGWDVSGEKSIDEVKPEQQTLVGPVDFSLRINGKEKIYFEIKRFSEDLLGSRLVRGKRQSYEEQILNYAWYQKVDWAVLTNFKEIRLYYTHVKKPIDGRVFKASFDEYLSPEILSKLWLLSKEGVSTGFLDKEEKKRTRKDVDAAVLEDLFESRKLLTKDVYKKHKGVDTELIKEGIQRILDRLLVMRFMEDKGIEKSDALHDLFDIYNSTVTNKDASPFMSYIKNKFLELNETYNSKVFEPHLCDKFAISNLTFSIIIKKLYTYNFDLIDADVLGHIYEDYLGHVLEESGRDVEIVEKQTKRKEHGIYYTPTYIVDYIVRNTIGALIEEKKHVLLNENFGGKDEKSLNDEEKNELGKAILFEINKIKILDPACGSGSFLIKAFDVLKEYHNAYEMDSTGVMTPEKKILLNNIHGVDLDRQATEIASVNLILKALKKGEKLPLILDENIKCGNSLISGTEDELRKYFDDSFKEKKPFNWEDEFSDIFKNGGFDVVIGNPPYGAVMQIQEKSYLKNNYVSAVGNFESYCFFLEKAINLMRNKGYFGFIMPNTWLTLKSTKNLRKLVLDTCCIKQLEQMTEYVFEQANVDTVLLILQKEESEEKRNNNLIQIDILSRDAIPKNFIDRKFEKSHFLAQKNWLNAVNYDFNVWFDESVLKLSQKIEKDSIRLGDLTEICRGMNPYDKYVGHTSEMIKNRVFHATYKKDDTYVKELVGSDIKRYLINIKSKNWVSYGEWLAAPRDPKFFKEPHILIQRIRNLSLKQRIVATYVEEELYNNSGLTNIILINNNFDLKYFLAILNSKMLNWYYRKKYTDINIKPADLVNIPIKPLSLEQQKPFIELAGRMLLLNHNFHTTLSTFNKILVNMSDNKTDSRPLKDYYPSSDYGISPVVSKKLIDIHLSGKVTKLEVSEIGNDLVISGEYFIGEKDKGVPLSDDILLIRFTDPTLKRFFYYSIKTFLQENSKKKVWGKGKIVDVVLKSIKIPRFYNLKIKDIEKINEFMDEFFKASPIGDKSLTEIEREIDESDKKIDELVYKLYDLTDDEYGLLKVVYR